ncbi:MAG: sugar phosphate isomerase/epimerase [Clostridium sp.]|nr:sugar phosphate isomerase/epimerase [Clostridium sp.]
MDFGMPFLIETSSQEECIRLCKSLGLQFIEWNMNFPQCQLENFQVDMLNEARERENIYYTLHLEESINFCDFNSKVRRAYLETALESIALGKKIGAPIINMHLAKGIYITLPDRKRFLFEEYSDFYYDNLLRFREECEAVIGSADIRIGVENTDGFQPYEQKAVELLLESPCFGLTLDIGHSHAAGNRDMPFYEKHVDRLIHMHAHDGLGKRCHLAFGDGEIDLRQRLEMAEKAGARVVLETKTVEALKKTRKYMEENFLREGCGKRYIFRGR